METLGQPTWFGQYRLTSRIATGGMAEVYLGRHITPEGTFGPMVAVKRLLPHLVKDQAIVRMFLNEARITAQISHPNVVRIVDLGNAAGEPYIAMELLDGRTFSDLREKVAEEGKRVPLPITMAVLAEACLGLDAAHRAVDDQGQPLRLVHRDFTPDNIHVGFKGDVKVIDFGVAKTAMWGAGTEPGTLKGKFFYMSPEMILARPVDHRADVFATGVMLYEQLCGRRPFTGNSVDEVVMRIAQGRAQTPRSVDPSVPPGLEAICLRALAHDPEARFQSLQDFVDALSSVGGAAQLATREELGRYVDTVFPKEKDARRQTLRRARALDPSHPSLPTPARGSDEADAQLAAEALPFDEGAAPTLMNRPPAAPPAPSAGAVASAPAKAPPPGSRRALLGGVAALVVVALAVTAVVLLKPEALPPAEAVAKAAATNDGPTRARLLAGLGAGPATPAQLARAGALLLEVNEPAAALELAEAWQARAPDDAAAFLLEGRAAVQARKAKRAETALERAAALQPKGAEPDVALAELRELQGDAAGALEAWARAAKKSPQLKHARLRQGYWLSQTGRLDEAQAVLGAAMREGFDAAGAAELAFVKFRKQDVKGALSLLKEVVRREPGQMAAHYYLGAVLFAQGDTRGARAAYLEADKLAPSDSRPLAALCEMEARTRSPQLAETTKLIQTRLLPGEAQAVLARCTAPPTEPEASP